MWWLDRLFAELLAPLAMWVFASGLDDLFLDLCYFWLWVRGRVGPRGAAVSNSSEYARPEGEKRIAIMVPCWREEGVIDRMLIRNLRDIQYANYDFWVGLYPNDRPTIDSVEECRRSSRRVHVAVCGGPGPSTKADCLNAIYGAIAEHEKVSGVRYEIILQHDAEDVIHPEALTLLARQIERSAMVQIPVFPLPRRPSEFTHGTYADEFAESHSKDLMVRSQLGGFVPSAGVGTAFQRETLARLAQKNGGAPFDSSSLTEDYSVGLQMHRLRLGQIFAREAPRRPPARLDCKIRASDLTRASRHWIATQGFFPDTVTTAIRQKSRWVTGITLQSWQRYGWRAGRRQLYWLWRDRKGLVVHPASLLANALCAYGLLRWTWMTANGKAWPALACLAEVGPLTALLSANFALLLWRQAVRMYFVTRLYGPGLGLTVPVRAPWGNFVNVCATCRAVWQFTAARLGSFRLEWDKTTHTYPGQTRAFPATNAERLSRPPAPAESPAALIRNAVR